MKTPIWHTPDHNERKCKMSRAMRKTAIQFGMVSVNVGIHKATESTESPFSQFHTGCNGPVGYLKSCKTCAENLDTDQIFKGVKDGDTVIPITDDDLAGIEIETGTTIAVDRFVHPDEIEQIYIGSHFFLEPSKESLEAYALLRAGMVKENKIAVVKFILRGNNQHLGIIRPYQDNALILEGISYPKEIREAAFPILDNIPAISDAALNMAVNLIDAMSSPFDAGDYIDVYRERLNNMIAAKASGAVIIPMPVKAEDTGVTDLMAKLAASVEKKKAEAPASREPYKAPAKKAPARKAPAKKVAVA